MRMKANGLMLEVGRFEEGAIVANGGCSPSVSSLLVVGLTGNTSIGSMKPPGKHNAKHSPTFLRGGFKTYMA